MRDGITVAWLGLMLGIGGAATIHLAAIAWRLWQ